MNSPPKECIEVTKAVLILLKGEKKNHSWEQAQKMFENPKQFIELLFSFDVDGIEQWQIDALKPIIDQDFFTKEIMMPKSEAAAYLCHWVLNMLDYN